MECSIHRRLIAEIECNRGIWAGSLNHQFESSQAKSADFAAPQEWLANRYATAFLKNKIVVTLGLGAIKKQNSDFIYFNGRVGP